MTQPPTRTYSSPADALAHAEELHRKGAISAEDLKRVRHQLATADRREPTGGF
jgi:hypothetical protein